MALPEDCIREILEYLSDDKSSLFTCLFVNRLFCICVVPILWRRPWPKVSLSVYISSRYDIYWKILGKTIIKCFPEEIRSILLRKSQFYYVNSSLWQKPLFNYVSYIQEVSPPIIKNLTS